MNVTNLRALIRYNFSIVWGHTPWLIVVPVAAGMLVLFWNMALASVFTPAQAALTTECLAPALAAFLSAHLLGVEYRQRAGEITFSKPFAAGRILMLRLLAGYLLIAAMVAVMLFVYARGIGTEFPMQGVILAGIPSVLFLSMLSLTVATLFRQPAMGLMVAGLTWAVDAYGGVQIHPVLSLQGYAGWLANPDGGLADGWRLGKAILLALAGLLYVANLRLIGRPEGVRTRRKALRNAAVLVGLLLLYLYTGAMAKVALGKRYEAGQPARARIWYREQFGFYGALPVARLVGRDFADYIGAGGESGASADASGLFLARSQRDLARLQRVLSRSPRGRWADHALFELARAAQSSSAAGLPANAPALYRQLSEQYPESVFAPPALGALNTLSSRSGDTDTRSWACRRLVERYPESREAGPAVQSLVGELRAAGRQAEALSLVEALAAKAPPETRVQVWQVAGDLLAEMRRPADARARYDRALAELAAQQESLSLTDVPEGGLHDALKQRRDLGQLRRQILAARGALPQ